MLKKGIICSDNGDIYVHPGLCFEEIKQLYSLHNAKVDVTGEEYLRVRIEPLVIDGLNWIAVAYFFKGIIQSFDLTLNRDDYIKYFGNVERPKSDKNQVTDFYQDWLEKIIGIRKDEYKYTWGKIKAYTDMIGGGSLISILYKK